MRQIQEARAALQSSDAGRGGLASAVAILVRVFGTAATFVYTLLMARVMSPHDVGVVWTIWSGTFIASVLATLNIGSGAVREVVKARVEGRPEVAAGFVAASRATLALVSPLVAGGFLALSYWTAPDSVAAHPWAYGVAALSIPLMGWVQTNASQAAALKRALSSQIPRALLRPLIFVVAFGVIYAVNYRPSPEFTVALYFCATLAAAAVQFVLLRTSFRTFKGVKPDTTRWRAWIVSGLALAPGILLADQLKNVVILFSAMSLDAAAVSQIAISLSIINFLNFSISAVDVQFGPRIASALLKNEAGRVARLQAVANLLRIGPTLVGGAIILVLGEFILSLFGGHYAGGVAVSAWFLLFPFSKAVFGNGTLIMQLKGHRAEIFWSSLIGTATIAAGIVLAGRASGVEAAAAAAGIAFAGLQLFRYLACRFVTGVDPSILGSAVYVVSRRGRTR